jgi:peptide/nickel transport system substrate-binding protein
LTRLRRFLVAVALLALGSATVAAADLRIGTAIEPSSMDPHYYNTWSNVATTFHIFDRLVGQDANQHLAPALAESWRPLNDTTWEFKLRRDVRFHDGAPFTADDVLFTLQRLPAVPNSPSSFGIYTAAIARAEAVDPWTLRVTTKDVYPLLPVDFSLFAIMGRKQSGGTAPEGKTTAELNAGDGVIGTGPYRFIRWVRGEILELVRNPDYWAGAEPWGRVTFRPIKLAGSRTSAFLSGEVDLIDGVPTADVAGLQRNPQVNLFQTPTSRIMFVVFDMFAEPTPTVADTGGRNPFKDLRVRQALSLAINRGAIIRQVMEGLAVPAAELARAGMFGADPELAPDPYNPEEARHLLAEAGYPNGFRLTLGAPSDGFENASQLAQAVASMWTRVGVRTELSAWTINTFFLRRNKFEFSAYVSGAQVYTGEASFLLKALLATPDVAAGTGVINKGRYSNPAMDALLAKAQHTLDDDARAALLRQTSRLAMADHGLVPLYFSVATWATRKGLMMRPYVDTGTYAMSVRPTD